MRKICLVSFCDIYVLPYANTYIESAKKHGVTCDLLYWARDKESDIKNNYPDCKRQVFYSIPFESCNIAKKIALYFTARNYFCKVLMDENYDRVVFLQSHGAVLCSSILLKKYKKRYLIDIRDYSLEKFKPYYYAESRLIRNAYSTIISSPAYKSFLPNGDYYLAHNYNPFNLKDISSVKNRMEGNRIRVAYVGTVRFYEMDKKMLSRFANDTRFTIKYFGRGSEVLEQFCVEQHIENVDFRGAFNQSQTVDFYKETDLINNLYGNHCNDLDYALSNKLYHCIQLHIPILVCPNTYMAEIAKKYNLGFVVDLNDSQIANKLFQWYKSFDVKKFQKGCDDYLKQVKEDNQNYYQMIDKFMTV